MATLRLKRSGTYDRTAKRWELKGERLRMSIRQLSEWAGKPIPADEELSRPYWDRWLSEYRRSQVDQKKATSPLKMRIASLEGLIRLYREQGLDCAVLTAELARSAVVPEWDIDHEDTPVFDPAVEAAADALRLDGDDLLRRATLTEMVAKPIPRKQSLKREVEAYISSYKTTNAKVKAELRRALQPLLDAVNGDYLPAMALRKTVNQMIYDRFGREVALTYRCALPTGVEGDFYLELSPEQVRNLDAALQWVHTKLFTE